MAEERAEDPRGTDGDGAHEDETASKPPADVPPGSEHDDSEPEEGGGPHGNPGTSEEALRKQQEERSRGDS
jgi:hypothetical protein